MENRNKRLLYLIEKDFGGSQVNFAKAIDRSTAQVNALVKNRKHVGDALALYIERTLNLGVGWFDKSSEGEVRDEDRSGDKTPLANQGTDATPMSPIEAFEDGSTLTEGEVELPFYTDISLSAGNGFSADIQDFNNRKLRFSSNTLRSKNINPAYAVCICADGDSMEPVIPDGAIVGINTEDKTLRDDKLYAINHDGLLRIKILRKRPSNKVLIQSYNTSLYPDEEVALDEISIIGRIFWWSVFI